MLRAIADNDIKNFSGEGQSSKGKSVFKFEGNIEEQTLILYKNFTKEEIVVSEPEP